MKIRIDLPDGSDRAFDSEDHIYLVGTSGVLTIKKKAGEVKDKWVGHLALPMPVHDTVIEFGPNGWLSVEEIE